MATGESALGPRGQAIYKSYTSNGPQKAFDAVGGVALAAYLVTVVVKGNGTKLVEGAKEDWEYLEFLAAIYLLYLLHKSDFGGQIADLLITTAIVAVVLKIVARSPTDFSGTLTKFAKGELGLFETLKTLAGSIAPENKA